MSHNAKHTRGLVARHLLESGRDPSSPKALRRLLADRWAVELTAPARRGAGWNLTVVETA